jgi:endonuclease/exonuclease/phosphatase family metal-dependent hydrolase
LKVASLNMENLFLHHPPDQLPEEKKYRPLKDHEKCRSLATAILEIDADVMALSEVGGEESLASFTERYLEDTYHHSLIQGNSDRGIELGFLIKKGLPYTFEHLTHRNSEIPLDYKTKDPMLQAPWFMSRDIAELRILKDGEEKLIVLNVHLKSRLDVEGLDNESTMRRRAEVELLVDSFHAIDKKFEHKVPIIITGDFNGYARPGGHPEFERIHSDTNLVDVLEVMKLPQDQRASHVYFDRLKTPIMDQLDYLFIPPTFHSKVIKETSGLYFYKDQDGIPFKRPQYPHEGYALPSDHLPIVVDLDWTP